MNRLLKISMFIVLLSTSAFAGSDGQNELSKNSNGEVKDCFETINRGVFSFNEGLIKIVFQPLEKG